MKAVRVSDLIARLKSEGLLALFVREGIISPKFDIFFQINQRVEDARNRYKRKPLTVIELDVADEFQVGLRTVRRARFTMNRTCQFPDKLPG